MTAVKTLLYLGAWVSAWSIITAGENSDSRVENVHWRSLDFKTILTWTCNQPECKYTVLYAQGENVDWMESQDCSLITHHECDLTKELDPIDRNYKADIRLETEPFDYDIDEHPHTFSPEFNPYRESNISAVEFSLGKVNETTVTINITDPVTSFHQREKQLTVRDILKKDLKYKIIYYKAGSTREREVLSDSSTATVSELDAGLSYCFMVAAFIPARSKAHQHGAWSTPLCREKDTHILQELSLGAWTGIVCILITVFIIIIIVIILCSRRHHRRNTTLRTSRSSSPI
ncbi:tissue factor-like [Kryptolebias marmoratus]|uniref:tissue factor-like n=1 Tax=Kryptolebias marmoratus TaxID=37003 RepID=UPI0018ACD2ED|nr:tissue factor-like [Kryptolebias marmoratus]